MKVCEHVISVVVPCYNVQEFVEPLVECLRNQTFRDFEVIFVNDGSTDRTPELLQAVAIDGVAVHVVHQENRGLSEARNTGADNASGEWIAFIDPDDLVASTYLEYLWEGAQCSGVDIVGYRNTTKFVGDLGVDLVSIPRTVLDEGSAVIYTADQFVYQLSVTNLYVCTAYLYRRGILQSERFTAGILFEDTEYMPRALSKSNKVCVIQRDDQYYYRQRPGGIIHSANPRKIEQALEVSKLLASTIGTNFPECLGASSIVRLKLLRLVAGQLPLSMVMSADDLWSATRELAAEVRQQKGAPLQVLLVAYVAMLPRAAYFRFLALARRIVKSRLFPRAVVW